MKTTILIAFITTLAFCSCEKTDTPKSAAPSSNSTNGGTTIITDTISAPPFPQQTANGASAPGCSVLPIYGDTLIYPQPATGQDNTISPVNSPGSGQYFAWPTGMVIDRNTGTIDLSKSQSGMKYAIGFVAVGTTDTCLSSLVLGGASYLDSVYVLVNGSSKATPYFDANPSLASNCNGSGQGSGCKFDVNGAAATLKVSVNNSSGEIDLKKTLDGNGNTGGAFGLIPFDGETIIVPVYYQLKHGSNNATQVVNLQLMYYDSKASMQASLMTNIYLRMLNALNNTLISTSANPRPPILVITRNK